MSFIPIILPLVSIILPLVSIVLPLVSIVLPLVSIILPLVSIVLPLVDESLKWENCKEEVATMNRSRSMNEFVLFIHLLSLSLFTFAVSEVCDGPVLPFEPDTGFLEMEVIAGFRVWQLAFMGAMAILCLIIVLCCFFRCRIPRTKQEIEADVARKKVTKRFRSHLQKLPVDKMELDKVLPEVIELEAKRLKRGEIEQKKTLFQKIKSIFFDPKDDEDEDEVSKATISFEEGTEITKKKEEGEEEEDEEFEDETESSSEYDEHGDKIMKEKKRRRKKDESLKGLRDDDDDTSSEESKRIKKQYLSLSYKQSSNPPLPSLAETAPKLTSEDRKKNNTLDSVNITIEEEEEENGVKPEDIESALNRLREEHMKRELQGKSSSTESRDESGKKFSPTGSKLEVRDESGKKFSPTGSKLEVVDDDDGRSHSLPDKSGDRKLSSLIGKTMIKQKTCAAIIEHVSEKKKTTKDEGKKTKDDEKKTKDEGKKTKGSSSSAKVDSPKSTPSMKLKPESEPEPQSKLAPQATLTTFRRPLVPSVSTPCSPSSTTLARQRSKVKPVPPPKPASLTLLRSQGSKEGPMSPSSKHPQLSRQVELMEVDGLKLSTDGLKLSGDGLKLSGDGLKLSGDGSTTKHEIPIYEEVSRRKGAKKAMKSKSSTSSSEKHSCSCDHDHDDESGDDESEDDESEEDESEEESDEEEERTKF